jgi:hypothetical protein
LLERIQTITIRENGQDCLACFISILSLKDIAVALDGGLKDRKKEELWNSAPPSKYLN